jgi:membrane protein implicated in regulation of membrane protease activity
MKSSKLFSLNIYDFLKGLIVAVLTPIIVFAQGYFANGTLDIEWQALMAVGLSGLLAYLIKNFFSDAPALPEVSEKINDDINSLVGGRPNDRAPKK